MRPDGWSHLEAGRLDEAAAAAAAALAADSTDAAAVHLTGVLAWRRGDAAEAMEALRRASELLGDAAAAGEVLRDLCEMLRVGGRIDEAARAGKRAVSLRPHDANAHYNRGIVLQELGDLDGSIAALRAAVALAPRHAGAHFELAEALLLRGDFADGWEEYEWRFDVAGAAPLMPNAPAAPKWTGEPMPDGRLLLVADQGYGDVIQFMRYVPEAEARCGAVVIACSSETATLVRQVAKTTELFQVWDDAPRFDCYAALSSLPRLFGTRLETVPSTGRYLVAEPARAACWRERLKALTPAGFRTLGVVWAGGPTHGNDANRSLPLAALAPLGALERTALIGLQKGEAAAQVGRYFGAAPLINLGPEIRDFSDTAAIIANLDLVVSVDTSVAHLAGALGQPTSVLLPFAPDWRWLRERSDSPWYPSLRLYRQSRRGDWTDPVARLVADIRQRTKPAAP
jgi:hypothetical protein